jgi:predicted porin
VIFVPFYLPKFLQEEMMNKKLLTVAIGAALAAGPILASADVKLYGKVHMSVDYTDAKGLGASTVPGAATSDASRKGTAVSSNASRWGIDVSEKLGGGMTAIAKLEQDIGADGDSNSQNARNRYVGMKGKFGQIIAGIHDTPLKLVSRDLELFPEYIGDNRNLMSTGGNGGQGWDLRPANVIQYNTPSMNGFTFTYNYSADTTAVAGFEDNRRRADSFGLKYAKGPLYVNYAYETHRLSSIADTGNPTEKGQRLGASYNFGAFKLVAMHQSLSDLGGTVSGGTAVKRTSYVVGGAYTAGNNVFKAQYVKAGSLNNFSAGTSGVNTGAKMWAIGWDHLFSKTVKAYVAYAKTDNDINSTFSVNGPSAGVHSDFVAPAAGLDPSSWSVGMIVDF